MLHTHITINIYIYVYVCMYKHKTFGATKADVSISSADIAATTQWLVVEHRASPPCS